MKPWRTLALALMIVRLSALADSQGLDASYSRLVKSASAIASICRSPQDTLYSTMANWLLASELIKHGHSENRLSVVTAHWNALHRQRYHQVHRLQWQLGVRRTAIAAGLNKALISEACHVLKNGAGPEASPLLGELILVLNGGIDSGTRIESLPLLTQTAPTESPQAPLQMISGKARRLAALDLTRTSALDLARQIDSLEVIGSSSNEIQGFRILNKPATQVHGNVTNNIYNITSSNSNIDTLIKAARDTITNVLSRKIESIELGP